MSQFEDLIDIALDQLLRQGDCTVEDLEARFADPVIVLAQGQLAISKARQIRADAWSESDSQSRRSIASRARRIRAGAINGKEVP